MVDAPKRRILVDACVLSELGKKEPCERVVDWLEEKSNDLCLNVVTIKELYYGALRMPEGHRRDALVTTIENLIWLYHDDIVSFDDECALICARLHNQAVRLGRTPQIEDLMIAAMAMRNGATIATRNVRDFELFDVEVINPFQLE